jgi:hypothetical protein
MLVVSRLFSEFLPMHQLLNIRFADNDDSLSAYLYFQSHKTHKNIVQN